MKKFLAVALLLVLVVSVFVVASTAAEEPTYWAIHNDCLIKSKVLSDGTVPTFKLVDDSSEVNGLLVGLPRNATFGEAFFQAKDGYTIEYTDKNGNKISSSDAHIGTTDKVVVYKNGTKTAVYGIVTYGDADGDGYFDVIDSAIAALCLGGKMSATDNPAVYESVKSRVGFDNDDVVAEDYQQIVNDTIIEEKDLEDNLKGRKIPVDEALSFESVIYANTGATRAAAVTATDSRFKELITINYNDVSTAPSASGIYSVTAEVPDSEKYLVTPGTRELGFIVIAPKNATGYTTVVDNANKKITININNFYTADATFDSYISGWYNSAYNLKMGGNTIADGASAINALSPRTITKYTQTAASVTFSDATNLLGCYLPDDYTLWNNENANKTVAVSLEDGSATPLNYNLVIQQDAAAIATLRQDYFTTVSSAARGQRYEDPAETKGGSGWLDFSTKALFVSGDRFLNSETGKREDTISVIMGNGRFYPGMTTAFDGTGLKTVLVGYVDAIMFTSGSSKAVLPDISSNATLLYNTAKSNRRYSNYSGTEIVTNSSEFMGVINSVLAGFPDINVSLTSTTEELVGKSGWCRYACVGSTNGLRYKADYFLQFNDLNTTNDNHNTITVKAVDGCTITTNPAQDSVYKEKDEDGNVIATFYHKDSMTKDEVFRVSATLANGYKLSVTDASGKAVEYDAENNWYIMPNSSVTVTAVKA